MSRTERMSENASEVEKLNFIEKIKKSLPPAQFAIWLADFELTQRGEKAKPISDREKKTNQIKAGDRKQSKA